jgi:hypothetical protein
MKLWGHSEESTQSLSPETQMINPWFALGLQTARLAWEAQTVVALRMMCLAAGGAPSESEALLSEKMDMLAELGAVTAPTAVSGGSGNKVAKGVPNVCKKAGRNRRRLSTTPSSDTISHVVVREAMSNRSLDAD